MSEAFLFTCERDAETLEHSDPDDAVESYLDQCGDPLPEKVTVYGYARLVMEPGEPDPGRVLERVLEELDEEYGDPDDATDATPAMLAAAREFCEAIRREYPVWRCEKVEQTEVDVATWVEGHRPDWLGEAIP